MRPIYATRFRLESRQALDTPADFDTVRQYVTRWIENKYRGRPHLLKGFSLTYDGAVQHPVDGNELVARDRPLGGGRLMELTHIEADPDVAQREWRTSITLASDGKQVEFSLLLRIGSSRFTVQPHGRVQTGPPRVVRDLIRDFACKAARVEITGRDTLVLKDDVPLLVREILLDPNRALPVVLVSQFNDGRPMQPAQEIRDKLVGLAHVYEIDYDAGYELTRLIGRAPSCFNGAVRLYWPGFLPGEGARHPLFTPEKMEDLASRWGTFEDSLFRRLSEVAATRFVDSPVVRTLRQAEERARREEMAAMRQSLEDARKKGTSDDEEWLADYERMIKHNEELSEQNQRLEDQVLELQYELETAKQNMMAVQQHQGAGQLATQEDVEAATDTAPTSVRDVLDRAARRFSAHLVIWDSAYEAAEDSSSSRLDDIYETLDSIAELSRRYFASPDHATGPWVDFFRSHGLNYGQGDSETTMNMYGDKRIFRHNGTQRQMQQHLTVAKNNPTDCVQIYFDVDKESQRFVVGYCGPHLPTYTSTF